MIKYVLPIVIALAAPAAASVPDCERLAREHGSRVGAPPDLVVAVARHESGYDPNGVDKRAWPWAVNFNGEGHYFDTRQEALAFITRISAAGAVNFDVGCMQINYRWHGDQFSDLNQMLDPDHNVAYGADYLASLASETGDWETAVGRYHSRDDTRATQYAAAVANITDFGPVGPAFSDPGPLIGFDVSQTEMAGPQHVPPRLRVQWDKVEHFRMLLAQR